mgnify:CR=1 FL=1
MSAGWRSMRRPFTDLVGEKLFYLVGVFLLNQVFNVVNVFLVHLLVNYKLRITTYG